MFIEQISIKGFGKFSGLTIKLEKGLNIIYGSNEAGKTTLVWFIKGMLYGLKGGRASRDGLPSPLKRFRPWKGDAYGGSLEYRLDNGSVFRIDRNFDTNTAAVFDESFKNITGTFELSRDKGLLAAEKHLGLSESCFDRTVMVRQMETRMDYSGSEELISRLVNISQTGQEDISFKKASEILREAIKRNIGTERTTTQPMDKITARLTELGDRRRKLVSAGESGAEAVNKLQQLRMEEAGLKRRKVYLDAVKGLIDVRTRAEEERECIKRLSELEVSLSETEQALRAASGELDTLKSAAFTSEGGQNPGSMKRKRTNRKVKPMPILFFGAAAAAFAVWAVSGRLIWLGAALLSLLALAAAVILPAGKTGPSAANTDNSRDIGGRLQQYEKKMQRVMELSGNFKDLCNEASLAAGQRIEEPGQLRKALSERKKELLMLEERLAADTGAAALNGIAYGAGFFDAEALGDIITGSSREWLRDSWEYEAEKANEELLQIALKIKEYETLARSFNDDGDELQSIDEEIAGLEAEKKKMEKTGAALKMALEVLTESSQEIQQSYAPGLNSAMSRIIHGITGGRYRDLRADDSLVLNTVAPETGFVGSVMTLSGGTVDQMYLALRLAVADLLSSGRESLPLFLDEAFAQYDDYRLGMALKYLIKEYNDRQLILFTCREREVEAAEEIASGSINVIRL